MASGKSSIAKAISLATGAHIITPTNLLIDQYVDTFTGDNYLKGKAHYSCSPQMSCSEWVDECEQKPCPTCPYMAAKSRALTEPTFFNPMSYWYHTFAIGYEPPDVLVVDEAHTLINSLLMVCGIRLRHSEYRFPADCSDEMTLAKWLTGVIAGLEKVRELSKKDRKKVIALSKEIKQMKMTAAGLMENPQNYAIWTEKGLYRNSKETYLNIKPLSIPQYVRRRIFDADKVVLMSGTMLKPDIRELVGDRPYLYKDIASPIAVNRRAVFYAPVPFKMNYTTPPEDIAKAIDGILSQHRGVNSIIHVSYGMSKKLQPYLRSPHRFNDNTNKDDILEGFKKYGGVFLAAGCAEGIDLKGDLARINIIPKLLFPDLNDPVVKKRKALADGDEWYALSTLKTLIQQCGRTTRDINDYSITYILDPTFSQMYRRYKHLLPAYFKESIQWAPPSTSERSFSAFLDAGKPS